MRPSDLSAPHDLWRAFEEPAGGSCVRLGSLVAPVGGARLAVFDPNLAPGATPLERELPPSSWSVAALSRGGRVVAVRGERSIHDQWCVDGALERSGGRVWRFRHGERGWSICRAGATVIETAQRSRAPESSKTKELRDEDAACRWVRSQILRKVRAGYVPDASGPPVAWEHARFADGSTDFPVDYAVAAITDQLGLDHLQRSAGLRDQVARGTQGPPGSRMFEAGPCWCVLVWFPSGGDGRFACYWGLASNGEPSSLLVVLGG